MRAGGDSIVGLQGSIRLLDCKVVMHAWQHCRENLAAGTASRIRAVQMQVLNWKKALPVPALPVGIAPSIPVFPVLLLTLDRFFLT